MKKMRFEYSNDIEEILDNALNDLPPEEYQKLLRNTIDRCTEILED